MKLETKEDLKWATGIFLAMLIILLGGCIIVFIGTIAILLLIKFIIFFSHFIGVVSYV